MSNSPVLHLLGLAKKAGKLELGEEPVGAACRARHAKLVLLASDTAANTRRRAAHFGEAGNVLWLEVPFSKEELGLLFGRSSCAMLALTDAGFSASIVEKLTALDPEKYGPAALKLREKADRVYQRQKEQRQHEKNLQQGKQKPWSPPPKQVGKDPGAKPAPRSGSPSAPHPDRPARSKPATSGSAPGRPARPKPLSQGSAPSRTYQTAKPKPLAQGASAPRAKDGCVRPGRSPKPGPGQRRLTGKFRHNP